MHRTKWKQSIWLYSVRNKKYFLFNNNFNSPLGVGGKITIMEITARLTGNAEVKTLKDDRKVVNFNVAINDSYKPKGSSEITKLVTYVQCAYWVNSNIAQYLTKGTLVELQGRIGVNAYNNMQGEAKAALTFHVNSIKLHGKPKYESSSTETVAPVTTGATAEPSDDLPF